MAWRLLAISDTHLGEENSLLSFPHGRQHLWRAIRTHLGSDGDRRLEVDEAILVGDIPDRTLSSTSQIITHTNAFIQTLGSSAKIKKGVYVPGNHDHTLWTDYHTLAYGKRYGISAPSGRFDREARGALRSRPKRRGTPIHILRISARLVVESNQA